MSDSPHSPSSPAADDWTRGLDAGIRRFLAAVAVPGQPGRFLPCPEGATATGRSAALPFACFALKIEITLGLWSRRPQQERESWVRFLQSFQREDAPGKDGPAANPFIDPALADAGAMPPRASGWRCLLGRVGPPDRSWLRVLGETKQAIATLAEAGDRPLRPFGAFPLTPEATRDHLRRLDWERPWSAGAQASVLSVLARTQAPDLIGGDAARALLVEIRRYLDGVADPASGAYFSGSRPKHGQLVNGAMKVLTALDWLDQPIHYPDRLIDTCLARPPKPEGCHLIDAVYVLERCLRETGHRREEVRDFARRLMDMIGAHWHPTGGFSYFIGRSETEYQGRKIAEGRDEADIHATCLLTWAIAMIDRIVDHSGRGWTLLRP